MLANLLKTSSKDRPAEPQGGREPLPVVSATISSVRDFLAREVPRLPHSNEYRTLQGIERTTVGVGADTLLFHGDGASWSVDTSGTLKVQANGTVSAGTFRNSFFYAPWMEYTQVHRLFLQVRARGRFRLRLFMVAPDHQQECLLSLSIVGKADQPTHHRLPDLDGLWRNGRLFWDIKPETGAVDIFDMSYVTDEAPSTEKTILFLGRTYGRTKALVRVLRNIVDQRTTEDHVRLLASSKFLILDTSSKDLSEYRDLSSSEQLNLCVCSGANLGGGGNAAQVLNLFLKQDDEIRAKSDYVVLFDDDLDITAESLARYRNFANYMTKDAIVTLPILMKSHPLTVWEDGGFWGRFNASGGRAAERTEVFPQLIKHGYRLEGFNHLDEFAQLTHPEYSTFIFFAMSRKIVERLSFPAPFFLRGDDIEYSLRAGRQNIKVLSNPNLCAWHEPAHSYGQEYMAILHGLIINFTYGTTGPSSCLKFFNDRYRSHGAIRDGIGLRVYTEVLASLVRPSKVLGSGFEKHYFEKIALFKSMDERFENIDKKTIHDFLSNDTKPPRQLLPFVYMNPEFITDGDYVLHNHHQGTYFFRDLSNATLDREFYACSAEFASLLMEFLENFDTIAGTFREKLAHGIEDAFWNSQLGPLNDMQVFSSSDRLVSTYLERPVDEAGGTVELDSPTVQPSLPADFDPAVYVRLNPDVGQSDIPATEHYLQFGWHEGRRWK